MKFKERLWQLFLMIVLGVTLSVCDAGDSDDDFDENLLTAGTAIASGSSSTSITSGENWVKFGNFMILSGKKTITNVNEDIILEQSYGNNHVFFYGTCATESTFTKNIILTNNLGTPYSIYPEYCTQGKTLTYTILGKYQ